MNRPRTAAAQRFLAQEPTFIGRVLDTDYYEHPTRGDEAPLVAITADGRCKLTDHYDLPSINDQEPR